MAAVAVVLGLMAGAAGAAAEPEPVDQKALPGSICVPANPGNAGDFRYRRGEIRNVGARTRTVECPILRDGFFGGLDRIEALNVFIEQPSRGKTRCRVSVTDVRTGDDSRIRSGSGSRSGSRGGGAFTRSTSESGNRRLVFSKFDLTDTSIVHLRCELPPEGLIRGILWEERPLTDRTKASARSKAVRRAG